MGLLMGFNIIIFMKKILKESGCFLWTNKNTSKQLQAYKTEELKTVDDFIGEKALKTVGDIREETRLKKEEEAEKLRRAQEEDARKAKEEDARKAKEEDARKAK